jgi:hypothetical protein
MLQANFSLVRPTILSGSTISPKSHAGQKPEGNFLFSDLIPILNLGFDFFHGCVNRLLQCRHPILDDMDNVNGRNVAANGGLLGLNVVHD